MSEVFRKPEFIDALSWLSKKPLDQQLYIITQFSKGPEIAREKLSEEDIGCLVTIMIEIRNLLTVYHYSKSEIVKQFADRFKIDESVTSFLVDKVEKLMPTIAEDAAILMEASIDQLREVAKAIVDLYLIGSPPDDLARRVGPEIIRAAQRLIMANVNAFLVGDLCIERFKENLMSKYGYPEEKATALIEPIRENIASLREVLLFRTVTELETRVSELTESLEKVWMELKTLTTVIKERGSPTYIG